jgi:predicted RNA-binding protein YlxR (DUF448 family)
MTLATRDSTDRQARRRCAVSGAVLPRASLLRFAADRGRVVADVLGRTPGRGLWLSPRRDMIETAAARRLFSRVRGWNRISVPDDLAEQAKAAMLRHCLDLVGLARRAGEASTASVGAVAVVVETAYKAVVVETAYKAVVVETADATLAPGKGAARVIFPAGTLLGQAVGEPGCRRVEIAAGTFAERILVEADRLSGFGEIRVERNAVGTAEAGYGAT